MERREAAFATLGLRRGADRTEIEQAYRRLMKLYHPDYFGGDGARAAEINGAFAELLRPQSAEGRGPRTIVMPPPAKGPDRWLRIALTGALALAAAMLAAGAFDASGWSGTGETAAPYGQDYRVSPAQSLDQPVAGGLIDRAVDAALGQHRKGAHASMVRSSRACLSSLSRRPSAEQFDLCAAYDEAAVILEDSDQSPHSGPFSAAAVTARQVSAARLVSSDSFGTNARLQEIRALVHLSLLSKMPAAVVGSEARIAQSAPVRRRRLARVANSAPLAARALPAQVKASEAGTPAVGPPAREAQVTRTPAAKPPAEPPAKPVSKTPKPAPKSTAVPAWQKPILAPWQKPLQKREKR